jgi:hypothetical protein
MESESYAVQRTALAGQESYTGEVIVSAGLYPDRSPHQWIAHETSAADLLGVSRLAGAHNELLRRCWNAWRHTASVYRLWPEE